MNKIVTCCEYRYFVLVSKHVEMSKTIFDQHLIDCQDCKKWFIEINKQIVNDNHQAFLYQEIYENILMIEQLSKSNIKKDACFIFKKHLVSQEHQQHCSWFNEKDELIGRIAYDLWKTGPYYQIDKHQRLCSECQMLKYY